MSKEAFRTAIRTTAIQLASYGNVLFDIQNERNLDDRPDMYLEQFWVQAIFDDIKSVHPARLVTASNTAAKGTYQTAQFTHEIGLDVAAYHDARNPDWYYQVPSVIDDIWYVYPWR